MEYFDKEYYNELAKADRRYINTAPASAAAFIEMLKKENIRCSAAVSAYKSTVTVNTTDYEKARSIYDELVRRQPSMKNETIGNTEYRAIRNRTYINTTEKTAREISKLLAGSNIRFSGIIRSNGSATITADGEANAANIRRMIDNIENADLYDTLADMGLTRSTDSEKGFIVITNASGVTASFENADALRASIADPAFSDFFRTNEPLTIPDEEHFYLRREQTAVDRIYYNPDGNDGKGQFVSATYYAEDIRRAYEAYLSASDSEQGRRAFLDTLDESSGRSVLIDFGAPGYDEYVRDFIDFKEDENSIAFSGVPTDEIISAVKNNFPEIREEAEKEKAPEASLDVITEESDNIEIEGYTGTWYVIESETIAERKLFLLEHEEYGDEAASLIVDENKNVVLDNVYNGFDDYREQQPYSEQLVEITNAIAKKQAEFTDLIKEGNYTMASAVAAELTEMSKKAEKIKSEIQKEAITDDVHNEISERESYAEKLYTKVNDEYLNFVNELKKESPDVLVESAAEIVDKERICLYLEENTPGLTDNQYEALLSRPNPLDEIYEQWTKNGELNSYEDVSIALEETADRILISLEREKLTINSKDISFDEAEGTWHVVDNAEIGGKKLFMLESDNYGYTDEVGHIIADENENILAENVHSGFAEYDINNKEAEQKQPAADITANYSSVVKRYRNENAEQLYTRVNDEYLNFVNELKKETPDVLVESAAEIVDKERICLYLEENTPELTANQYEALLSRPNPLDEIYEQWTKNGELNSYEDVSIALEETADRILISLERESSRSEAAPEVIEDNISEIKDIEDTDNIKEALDLDNNTITFSVIRIDSGEPIVTGDYIDQYGITDLDEYKDYIYDSGKAVGSITEVEVSYYMIGGGDNESYAANDDERDYISAHLEEVLAHRFTDLLEADTYSVRTPEELIEQDSSEPYISQKNLLFTFAEFEDGSKYVLPGKVDDNNIKDTEAWKEVKSKNFDINNIGELEEDIKVRLNVYQTGTGEASVPSQEELRELEIHIDDILFNASQISTEEAYIRPWTDVDDILYEMENTWKERHANEPNVSDGFDNSNFLYPKNLMRTAHSNGKDHYNLDDAILQIKLTAAAWLHPVDAAVEMNRRGVNIDDIEMLNVRYVSSDGTVGEKDLTPEQYMVYRAHNEERTTSFLAAVNSAENRTKIPEEVMNIIHNDMPSFVKSSVAWDELMEYDGISERLENGEDPVKVAKSYIANNGWFSWNSEALKDGYFTWSAKDKGDTAEISVAVNDKDTFREKYKSSFEVSWNDIADAFKKRIEQELNYNKLYDKTITVASIGDDKYRFIDKEKNVDVIKNRAELEELFNELFNKEELDGIIRQLIDNAPFEEYSAPENRIPDDMAVIDDKDNAVTMWEMGIKVYRNNEPVTAHEGFGDTEGIYTAAKSDIEIYNSADTIASAVWDMNSEFNSVPNEAGQPYYLSLEKGYDEWVDYEKGLNEYENTLNALFGGNYDTVAEYLENVRDSEDVTAELREKADGMLDEVKHFKELSGIPEKNNDIAGYSIYQIPSGERYRDIRYESMEHLSIMGQLPDRLNYEKVYEGKLDEISGDNKLEGIFKKFNLDRPEDYTGRSLSVSDVVVIEDKNGTSAHYVDDIGFKDISDIFLETEFPKQAEKEQTAEKLNIYDFQNIRLVSRSEWFDYTLGDDENPAFEEKNESYSPEDDGSFTKYAYNKTNSIHVDVWEEENSVSSEDMLAEIANHLNKMGRENSRVEYHIELTDLEGNMRRLDSGNFEFYSDNSSFDRILEEKPVPENTEKRKSGSEVEVGDRFLYNDREYTVTSEKGVYPDDVGVSYEEKAGSGAYVVSQNIDKYKLADNGIFLGNLEKENREAEKEKSSEENKSELTSEQRDDYVHKNNTLNNLLNNNPKAIFREIVAYAGIEPTEDITVEETKEMFGAMKSIDISLMGYDYTLELEPNVDTLTVKDTASKREADFVWGQVKELMYLTANEKNTSRANSIEDNSPEPPKDKSEYTPKIGDLIDINDELLIISDINSSIITFTEIENLFGNTSRMSMADFLASNFTVVEENESEIAEPDVPVGHLDAQENVSDKTAEKENVPVGHLEAEEKSAEKTENNTDVPVGHNASDSRNFVITDENLGVKTPKARFAANVEAIRTLNTIEAENRTATPSEQAVLSGYTGWGAIPQAFDSDNKEWSSEYTELKNLLSDDEYSAARRSTMNAHFTSPVIINAIYEGLANIGFEKGKILEPAMGIGNFFGAMPEAMRESELHGVELDSLTGRIAKQLYPDADIQIKGFEKTRFENDSFDAVVGNVPFGDYKVDDKDYNKNKFLIHDYFIAKSIDKVRPGGVLAVVTSKGTMDKENPEMRKYIAQRAELLGAIRLPNDAFKKNAGTEVTSDILFFQKRERPIEIKPDEVEWLSKGTTDEGFSVNNFFVNHPEMVLGTIAEGKQMYGPTENTQVLPIPGADLKQQLSEAVKNIGGTYTPQTRKAEKKKEAEEIIPAPANSRVFSYYAVNDNLYYRSDDENMSKVKLKGDSLNRALAMVEIRDTVRELLNMQLINKDHSLDGDISEKRDKLNRAYDSFTEKYGHFDNNKNSRLLKGDDGYNFLTALETKDNDSGEYAKADIFFHDTVKPDNIVEHVETAQEALILSISEKARVDFEYMTELCGMDKNTLINELEGQIFRLPQAEERYVTADEYLTGNIRTKLRELENAPEGMDISRHREALEAAMPKRVEAKDISVKLGSHWVDPEFVTKFMREHFRNSWKTRPEVIYSKASGKWKIEGMSTADRKSYTATHDYGTKRRNAYEILEGILNHSDLTVKDLKLDENDRPILDSKGNEVKVTNIEETKAVQSMVRKIEGAWQDWVFKDPDRRETLVNKYNEVFNSIRHREYDGSHLNFVGMNSDITMKEHQKNAVARALYGGNTLLAHAVGAGKSYEMITIAMEGKRLGLHNKSLFAVPNSLTEQMGRDFKKLYPAANILVATKKDFEPKNRKKLFAKIATGEWDAVIVGHSQLDKMGLSKERSEAYIRSEINDLREQLEEAKSKDGGKSFSVKEIEKTIARYEKKLTEMQDKVKKDEYIDFEEMGFDKLFVDECHLYKNLGTATKMSNVAGIGTTGSGKAAELLMKTKYFDEITEGKGLVFASGTPVSNSMTELYTMMRYLQTDLLKDCGINHFDEWAADFGEVKTDYELKPESDGKYQLKTRFAKFTNLPELMGMFKEAADIRTADTLNLEKPAAHVHEVVAQPSKIQKRLIKSLSKRAAKIRDGNVDPREDNMLCITNDGRKIGLDQRLMLPGCPDDPNSKVNMCVQNVFDIYSKTTDKRSTQVIFCDMSTPKSDARQDRFEIYRPDSTKSSGFDLIRKKVGLGSGDADSPKRISSFADIKAYVDKHSPEAEDKLQEGDIAVFRVPNEDGTAIESRSAVFTNGQFVADDNLLENLGMSPVEGMPEKPFNVYDDIKDKLIARGVPEKEIAFIHDYDTAEKKQALFNQMNSGEVRVLLGSTAKCGAGMNCQRKMIALHHLDAPLRPSDMEQRNGRIERQGNENPEVDIFRYVTDKSFDAYLYQILENKQKFISQVMTSKTPERVCSDIDEAALDYAEVKALCAGNPLIKKEMELQAKIKDLKMEKARYNENIYELQDSIRIKYPNEISQNELAVKHYTADLKTAQSAPKAVDEEGKEAYPMNLGNKVYPTRKEAGEALKEAIGKNTGAIMEGKEVALGEYRGLKLSVLYNEFRKTTQACLRGEKTHYCDLNLSTDMGNVIRLDNAINNIQKIIDSISEKTEIKKAELEQMKIDVEKPFVKEQELKAAESELEEVHTKLTQFELTDDTAQKDLFERVVDKFTPVLTGKQSYIKYEASSDAFMPLHVEMNSDILTISHTYTQNGDLMYDPLIDFKVDYDNQKVIPISYENSGLGIYESYDISDGNPETMKRINDILSFADDWMDNIDEQGYTVRENERTIDKDKSGMTL